MIKTTLPALGLVLLASMAAPVMAEMRGGPTTGGSMPQTPRELSESEDPCGSQQRPCGW